MEDIVLWFGKYKGTTIRDVININPGYIKWALKSGAIHPSQLPKQQAEEFESQDDALMEYESQLIELYGDKDIPHEQVRVLTEAEQVLIDPKFEVHRMGVWELPPAAWRVKYSSNRKRYRR